MQRIGLTGTIGSGKSTVAKILKEEGIPVIDSDTVAHEIMESQEPAYLALIKEFGINILIDHKEGNPIDRTELGKLVFASSQRRMERLRALTWPFILDRIEKVFSEYEAKGTKVAFVEAALLFESKMETKLSSVWVVVVPKEISKKRLMERNGINEIEAERRITTQMSVDEMKRRVNVIIDNTNDIATLKETVKMKLSEISKK